MADYNKLGKSIREASGQKLLQTGTLGYTMRGAFRVVDPTNPKQLIVRFQNGNWISAFNRGGILQIPGAPVVVTNDNVGRPYIVGFDENLIGDFLGGRAGGTQVSPHDHVRNSPMQYIIDTWLLKQTRMYVVSGTTVAVAAGLYIFNNEFFWFPGATIDLEDDLPTDTLTQWWAIVGIDPDTDALVVEHGTASVGDYPLNPAGIEDIPFIELGYIAVAAIWLNAGSTVLYNYQIEDMRYPLGASAGSGGIQTNDLNLSDPPTPTELDAAYPAATDGFAFQNDDNGTGDDYRLFVKQGTTWVMYQGVVIVGSPTIDEPDEDEYTSDTTPLIEWTAG